jgi:4-amino-4-deoxy-L-arabinose transferase-like glycosyltransferase
LTRKGQRPEPGQRGGGGRKADARGQAPPLLKEKRWVLVALLVVLALGGTLRGLYLAEFSQTPDFKVPFADADFHNYWARALAFGNWTQPFYEVDPHIREVPYFRPPGYAYFLAAVYKLTGTSYFGPRVVQMALGLVNALLAFLLARRYFGNLAGLVTAGLMATFWPFIYTETDFEEPVVSICLLLSLALVVMRWAEGRRHTGAAFGAGALVGLLGLMRPNALLLVLPLAAWAWWIHGRRGERGRSAKTAAALVAGAILLVSPATIRNYVVAHDFVPVSSNGGINLYVGNREGADGLVKITLPGIGTLDTCFDHLGIVESVERITGRPMKHSEVSNYFTGLALDWIRANPWEFVKLLWRKALLFWGPVEVGGNKIAVPERAASAVLSKIPVGFGPPLGLAVVGVALFWWERRRSAAAGAKRRVSEDAGFEFGVLALALVLTWYASYAPFANLYRYRAPILPFVFVFAGICVDRLVALARARDARHLVPWGVALAASLFVSNTNFARYEPNVAQWHYQNGIVMYRLGNLDQAIAEYRKALAVHPDYVTVMVDLGAALGTQGKIDEALPYFVRAARELPEKYEAQYNAALALEMVGDYGNARGFYGAALRVRPGEPSAAEGLARVDEALRSGGRAPAAP